MLFLINCRYIYFPVGGSRHGIVRQIAGSFIAFTFVWIWHGGYMSTLWWFIPNWLGVVMESLAETSLLPAVIKVSFSPSMVLESN